eukprot:s1833_g9.t1
MARGSRSSADSARKERVQEAFFLNYTKFEKIQNSAKDHLARKRVLSGEKSKKKPQFGQNHYDSRWTSSIAHQTCQDLNLCQNLLPAPLPPTQPTLQWADLASLKKQLLHSNGAMHRTGFLSFFGCATVVHWFAPGLQGSKRPCSFQK